MEVSGQMRRGRGNASSKQNLNFCVDGKAVFYSGSELANINAGDAIVVAGDPTSTGLKAWAYVNETDGTYAEIAPRAKMLGIALLILGPIAFAIGFAGNILLLVGPAMFIGGLCRFRIGAKSNNALTVCRDFVRGRGTSNEA